MAWKPFLLVLLMCSVIQAHIYSTGYHTVIQTTPLPILPTAQCINGGIVNLTCPANIKSPGSYYYYPSNYDCTWHFNAPDGHQIKPVFTSFDIEPSSNCMNDYVKVYDGKISEENRLATRCGNEIPVVEASSTGAMAIVFHSNIHTQRRGFQMSATCINMNKDAAQCNGNMANITNPTTIMSPRFPNNYPNGENCKWLITAPTEMKVQLSFAEFQVQEHEECLYDSLKVFDGSSTESLMMAKLCGTKPILNPLQSSTESLLLHFNTDQNVAYGGFKIFVRFVHPGQCEGGATINLTTPVEIFSPNYPGKYPNPVNCSWLITPQPGMSIYQVNRPYIDIRDSYDCSAAKLQAVLGPGSNRSQSYERCHSGYNYLPYLINADLLFSFYSQSFEGGNGFRMKFHARKQQQGVSVCGSTKALTSDGQYIVSPLDVVGYGYPPNTHCALQIKAPSGKHVKLTRYSLNMGYSTDCIDYLEFFNGQSENAPSISRLCRSFPYTGIVSPGTDILVVFHSGRSSSSYKRFRLRVQFISSPECGGTLTGNSGVLKSPQFAGHNHLSNANCSWLITVGSDKLVYLRVNNFTLELSDQCKYDSLKVYDGHNNTSPMIGSYCGTTIPQYITGTSNFMFVVFTSDNSLSDKGFHITFAAKYPPSGSD